MEMPKRYIERCKEAQRRDIEANRKAAQISRQRGEHEFAAMWESARDPLISYIIRPWEVRSVTRRKKEE